jgi:heavy metal sensor kinase
MIDRAGSVSPGAVDEFDALEVFPGRGDRVIRRFRSKQVRTRLTLWHVLVLASVLALSWGLTAINLFIQLRNQLTRHAVQDIETVEGLLSFDAGGRLAMREDYHNHPESKHVLERFLEVRSSDGGVIYRNERLGNRTLGGVPEPGEGGSDYSPRSTHLADGTPVRVVSRRHTLEGRSMLIRLAYSEEPIWEDIGEHNLASLLAVPAVLVLTGLGGYLLAGRALSPLKEMAYRAEQITSDRLHERLPIDEPGSELGRLATVFNNLLSRLQRTFDQLRRFTSDASHELRTPLTSIRSVGEVALQNDGSPEEYRDAIGSMLEEVNRLSALIDSLLTISLADAGCIQLHSSVFRAIDLAREAVGLFEVLVEEKGQRITVEGDESVSVSGDRLFLRQALINIVHNAVKYSPAGGTIHVGIRRETAGNVLLEVIDSGPGISPEHAAKVFDRFYRVDDSRSRQAGGTGLGLSIAQWAVRLNGGDIQILSKQGRGCTFRICLPPAVAPV